MKYRLLKIFLLVLVTLPGISQDNEGFKYIRIDKEITGVQPMTGIVFWRDSYRATDAVSLEFSYMLYSDVVRDSGVYNWDVVDELLSDIASRHHQAVLRFRYTYVGEPTSVPEYIKKSPGYEEVSGISEGKTTWFPDWSFDELKRFTLEFYKKFASRYDNDPRLAFLETGFGLWAEYHIYDGPFILGKTFPDKAFQEDFFLHLDTVFVHTPFMVSIDAASVDSNPPYTPFYDNPGLLNINFGLFDDSFMHDTFGQAGDYNTESWNFFGRERYRYAPAGGEFSYYSDYDQRHVLDWPDGPYGHPFEFFANQFHITFMIGADQPEYQSLQRIKQAGMSTGYKFKIVSFKSKTDSSVVTVRNVGVAPFYYDAYVTVDGVRSPVSLKLLSPGDSIVCPVTAGGDNPVLTITSDRLVQGQTIEYLGTENNLNAGEQAIKIIVYPNPAKRNNILYVDTSVDEKKILFFTLYDLTGRKILTLKRCGKIAAIPLTGIRAGVYFLEISDGGDVLKVQKLIVE